jgi:DNA-3-methyladenine glycosylase I
VAGVHYPPVARTNESSGLARGPDGQRRCWWSVGSAEYVAYHDEEWGRPVTGDDALYERLCLEGFQSGLAWITILRKREAFRAAFAGFEIEAVARFGKRDVKRLMNDAGIVRNRLKIEAAIDNARAASRLRDEGGSLSDVVWSYRERRRRAPRSRDDLAPITDASAALSKELKRRGFRFVGPTTVYAAMQACGLVNDHIAGCSVRAEVERERRAVGSAP